MTARKSVGDSVREWATGQGIPVTDKGPLPARLMEAYLRAISGYRRCAGDYACAFLLPLRSGRTHCAAHPQT